MGGGFVFNVLAGSRIDAIRQFLEMQEREHDMYFRREQGWQPYQKQGYKTQKVVVTIIE